MNIPSSAGLETTHLREPGTTYVQSWFVYSARPPSHIAWPYKQKSVSNKSITEEMNGYYTWFTPCQIKMISPCSTVDINNILLKRNKTGIMSRNKCVNLNRLTNIL